MIKFDINSNEAILLTRKLEKLNRSAFPVAVRGTLNKAAFEVKQTTMPVAADRHFIKRKPNFFKANSRVEMATGFEVNGMRATVGFIPRSSTGYNNYAVRELQQQEQGGIIDHRSFIPLDSARTGESHKQMVKPGVRLSNVKGVVNAANSKGANDKEKFIKAAIHAGRGGFVIGTGNKKKLFQISLINRLSGRDSHGRMTRVKAKAIYSFSQGRGVSISATHFMKEATLITASRLPVFYAQEAERQFKRVLK